jgi:adenylate cyclase class IV
MRELESKILGVDPISVSGRLEGLGAEKILDAITIMDGYDFLPDKQARILGADELPIEAIKPIVEKLLEITGNGKSTLMEGNAYLRLRREGVRLELILKQLLSAGRVKEESEISVGLENQDEWDKVQEYLERIGLVRVVHQEKKRISYMYDNLRFDIDTWPSLPSYLEIEGDSEEAIVSGANMLGFTIEDLTSHGAREIFAMYGVDPTNLVFKEGADH